MDRYGDEKSRFVEILTFSTLKRHQLLRLFYLSYKQFVLFQCHFRGCCASLHVWENRRSVNLCLRDYCPGKQRRNCSRRTKVGLTIMGDVVSVTNPRFTKTPLCWAIFFHSTGGPSIRGVIVLCNLYGVVGAAKLKTYWGRKHWTISESYFCLQLTCKRGYH